LRQIGILEIENPETIAVSGFLSVLKDNKSSLRVLRTPFDIVNSVKYRVFSCDIVSIVA